MFRSRLVPILALAACRPDAILGEVALTQGAGTVLEIRFETDGPARARLEVEGGPTLLAVEEDQPTASHLLRVVGLPPLTAVDLHLEVEDDDGATGTWDGEAATRNAPSDLPSLDLEVPAEDGAEAGFVLAALAVGPNAAALLSTGGWFTWWYVDPRPDILVTEVLPSVDGAGAWYGAFDLTQDAPDPVTELVQVGWDGTVRRVVEAPHFHHDFTELPDGTLAWLAYAWRCTHGGVLDPDSTGPCADADGVTVQADEIVELPPGGSARVVWSVFDVWTAFPEQVVDPEGWSHANSLVWEPDLDAWVVSLRNLSSVAVVGRDDGLRTLIGGTDSDWVVEGLPFSWQHGADLLDGGRTLLVFDNGPASPGAASRATAWSVDEATHTLTSTWSYSADPPLFTLALGDVERLPGGNLLVAWGSAGALHQATAEGECAWSVQADLGAAFGYAHWVPSLDPFWPPVADPAGAQGKRVDLPGEGRL